MYFLTPKEVQHNMSKKRIYICFGFLYTLTKVQQIIVTAKHLRNYLAIKQEKAPTVERQTGLSLILNQTYQIHYD